MRCLSGLRLFAGGLALAILLNGCGGRAINKKNARDVIVGSVADALAKEDVDVVSVTQVGAREAIVESYLHTAFRLEKVDDLWVVREVRVGEGPWEKIDDIVLALRQVKIEEARKSLERIAAAAAACREKTGHLPDFSNYVQLSDALYPLYLSPLIREDPWGHPLEATRTGPDSISLRSAGPDGKFGTPDDIELTRTFGAPACAAGERTDRDWFSRNPETRKSPSFIERPEETPWRGDGKASR